MRKNDQETQWTKHTIYFEHQNGQESTLYMQTDGNRYVLSEHPENKGPGAWSVAPEFGNEIAKNNLEVDPKSKPENVQLYAERQDGRFDQWQARTTKVENTSQEPNKFDHKASEWLWKNSEQSEHGDLEQRLGTKLEQGHQSQSRMTWAEQQQQQLNETALPKTEQSEQLRQAAQEQQSRQAAEQAAQKTQEQETQRQRHER